MPERDERFDTPRDHAASPGFIWTGSTGRVEKCQTCGRYLRHSKTSATGWRHSGLNG